MMFARISFTTAMSDLPDKFKLHKIFKTASSGFDGRIGIHDVAAVPLDSKKNLH